MPVLSIGDRRLGAILLQLGYVTDTDLNKALEKHSEIGGRLADILIDASIVSERRIARAIEDELSYPLVNLTALKPPPEVTALSPRPRISIPPGTARARSPTVAQPCGSIRKGPLASAFMGPAR